MTSLSIRKYKCMLGSPDFRYERFDKYLNAHSIIDMMTNILEHTSEKGPVLKNTIILFDDKNNNERLSDAMIINNSEESVDSKDECTMHFGGSSKTESELSTARLAITNIPNNNEIIVTSTY